MTIEEAIQALLLATPGVVALTGPRIRVPGDQHSVERPYIVHFVVACAPTQTHKGQAALMEWTYQVSCFSESYKQARELGILVREAIAGIHQAGSPPVSLTGFWVQMMHQYESEPGEVGIHHVAEQLTVFADLE